MGNYLTKEDYEEPRCLLNMNRGNERINVRRVLSTLDLYLDQNDYVSAERHLKFWNMEAESMGDPHGRLTILNEQIGLYRKTGREAECFEAIAGALALLDSLDLGETVSCGTTLVNAATGYKAFDRADEAMRLYRRAQEIYEKALAPLDERLGALYNNMALALAQLCLYREAEAYYHKALDIMKHKENGVLEEAITCLNLADLAAAELGQEAGEARIFELLDKAEMLLDTESVPRDGYYAFVCEKCAPVFGCYGYFLTEMNLKERARKIYEGNRTGQRLF